MLTEAMVIAGAGEAGVRAAMALRSRGWAGSIVLVGEEAVMPYDRPSLSKPTGGAAMDNPPPVVDPKLFVEQEITLRLGISVCSIDRESKVVTLSDGDCLGYRRLLIATGARTRRLAKSADPQHSALYLRDLEDAIRIVGALNWSRRIIVVGAGLIGLELACEGRRRGIEITVVEAGSRILARTVSSTMASNIMRHHEAMGTRFQFGAAIGAIVPDGFEMSCVTLADGTSIEADAVLVGIGVVPETSLASQCGLAVDDGILVDDQLRSLDPHILAAGDCCRILSHGTRYEMWRMAHDQSIHAAGTMLGDVTPFTAAPWMWSTQAGKTLQVTGRPGAGVRISRDLGNSVIEFELDGEHRLSCASAWGATEKIALEIKLAEQLIHAGAVVPAEQLADPATSLKTILKQSRKPLETVS